MQQLRTDNLLSTTNHVNPEQANKIDEQEFSREENFFKALQVALRPHLLRRFKREVLKDLPMRKEVIIRIEMTQD